MKAHYYKWDSERTAKTTHNFRVAKKDSLFTSYKERDIVLTMLENERKTQLDLNFFKSNKKCLNYICNNTSANFKKNNKKLIACAFVEKRKQAKKANAIALLASKL